MCSRPLLVFSPQQLTVGEGDTATYTLSLATQPTSAVTVTLSSSDTAALTVPGSFVFTTSNWNQPRTVTVAGVDDADFSDETVTVTHNASGGGYGAVSGTVTVTVTDDDVPPPALVFSPQQLTVGEGATATYTLSLATQPTGAVTVTLSSSDTAALTVPGSFVFTTSNWNQPRTVTVAGVDDDDFSDETVTVTHNASRGGYGSVSGTVTVTVTDDDVPPPALVFSPQQLTVDEGDTATYTLSLATQPNGTVTVTLSSDDTGALSVPGSFAFTTSNWNQPRTVTVRGVEDNDDNDETVTVTHNASRGGYGSVSGTVTVTVTDDDDSRALVLSESSLDVDEGDTATYTLRLATQPNGTVTVTLSSDDTGALSVPGSFAFTTSNWNQPRTVTVRGVEDNDDNDETVTVTHNASRGGYGGVSETLTVNVTDDDDSRALVLSESSLDVDEGDTATYTLRLATQPNRAVTVTLSSDDTGAVTVPGSFAFTTSNWNQPRTVTVTGVEDNDDNDETVTVTHNASRGGYGGVSETLTVNVTDDDDSRALVLSESSLDVDEGDTATYTLRLATQPNRTVTVTLSSDDTGAVTVPGSFAFTTSNWNQPRTVTVTGVDDNDDNDETVTVTHNASRGGYGGVSETLTVNVTDDDDSRALVLSESSLNVDEGDTATYTLRLATQPTNAVTVTLSSDDTGAVTVPGSFAFTTSNWNQPRTVTVTGVEDNDDNDETVTVTHNASRGGYGGVSETLTVNVADDDVVPPGYVFSPQQLSVDEGDTATYTLRLATEPTGAVTVALLSSDIGALAVPTSFVFTNLNWNQPRTVTVTGVEDNDTNDETVTVTHSSVGGGFGPLSETLTVNVTDDDTDTPNSAPEFTNSNSVTVAENTSSSDFRFQLTATDDDAQDSVDEFEVTGGTDQALLAVDSSDRLVFQGTAFVLDHETKSSYEVVVTVTSDATDGNGGRELTATQTITVSVTDESDAVPLAPQNVRVIDETLDSIRFAWDAPSNHEDAALTGYQSELASPGQTPTSSSLGISPTDFTQANLLPGTNYQITIRARHGNNQTSLDSSAVSGWTDDCAASTSTTCQIAVGGSASGRINVHSSTPDTDWYEITLPAGTDFGIEVKGSEPTDSGGTLGDPLLKVYDSLGVAVADAEDDSSGAGENSRIASFDAGTGGTYYVEVGEDGSDATGSYTLSITDSCASDTSTACSVTVGGSTSSLIDFDGDADWFSVEVDATNTHEIVVQGGDGSGELAGPFVTVYDSSGTAVSPEVSAGDDGDGTARIEFFTPASDGIYYIEVRDADDTGTGSYTVSLSARLNDAQQVTAGYEHACLLLLDSSITCWGEEFGGKTSSPTGQRFVSVSAGTFHTCAVTSDGSVECWGENYSGQTQPPASSDFVSVAAGWYHSCGLRNDGTITCWGDNSEGQLDVPADVSFSSLASGTYNTCGLATTDDAVVCWGANEYDESMPPPGAFSASALGRTHGCGIRTDGTAVCWGLQLTNSSVPAGTFTALAATFSNACALRSDATLSCWGRNTDDLNRAPLGQFVSVGKIAGVTHCVITAGSEQKVACWGRPSDVMEIPTHLLASVTYPAAPNTAPFLLTGGSTLTLEVREGGSLTTALSAIDDDPTDSVESYVIVDGADSASLEVDSNTGALSFVSDVVLDHETKQSYVVVVRITSGTGSRELTTDVTVTVNITDVNEAPEFTSVDTLTIGEDTQTSSFSHQVVAIDEDSDDDIEEFIVTGGADAASFEIDPVMGLLTFVSTVTLDHESGKTSYEVVVAASSGIDERERTASQTITVVVEDVEELPTQPGTPTRDGSGTDFVNIEWTAPIYAGPTISGYDVQYREEGTSVWSDWPHTATATRAEITGLIWDTGYEFQVRGVNDDGVGPWSDTLEVTTDTIDDCDEDTTTVCSVTAGSSATGSIDRADDGDWFSVALQAGTVYQIDVRGDSDSGGTLSDPAAAVFDSDGAALSPPVSDDDSGTGENARIALFVPTASGTHFIAVSGPAGSGTGTYTVEVSVIDTVGLVVDPDSLPLAEGASGTYVVSLSAAPRGTVTVTVAASDAVNLDVASLTFTTEDWATPQTVTVTAAEDPDAADEEAAISHTASGGGYQDVTAEVSVPVDDDETVGLRLSSTELAVDESATATYTVQLESPPTETVKVRVWRSSSGVTLSTTELTFTSADWSSPKTVTVTGADDNDSSPEEVTLTHRSSGAEYDSADTKTVEVTVSDDDTPGVMIDTTSVDLTEGGTATYTVVLQTQPSADVAVALTLTGSDDVAASPETLRFTDLNWDIARTVTVKGLQDDDASDEAATVGHTASGGGYDSVTIGDVSVAVDDDDTPSVTLTDTSLTLREDTSAVYAVVLDTEPSGPVTVTLTTTGSADVSVSPTTLTFTATNWEIAELVTVSAAQDADTTADQATVSHSASGADYGSVTVADVAVTVTDGEAQGVTITPITLSLPEGSSSTYSVVLTAEPTGSVTVTPSVSGSSDVVALPSVLTFTTTDWATAQIVTVTSTADADASDDLTIVTHALSGGGYDSTTAPDVLVTVGDPVGQPILDAVRAGDGAFRAEWSPAPVRADVNVTGYELQYRLTNGGSWSSAQAAATDTSLLVTGVSNNTSYEVQLRVTTDSGTSIWSDSYSVTVGRSEAPASLRVVPGHEEFYIDWEAPPNHDLLTRNGNSVYYVVRVAVPGEDDLVWPPTKRTRWRTWYTSTDGADLEDGTEYEVVVTPLALLQVGSILTGVLGTAVSTTAIPEPRTVEEHDPRHAALLDTIELVVAGIETAEPASSEWAREAWDFIVEQADNPVTAPYAWDLRGVSLDDLDNGVLALVGSACTSSMFSITRTDIPWCFAQYMRVDLSHWCGDVPIEAVHYNCVEDDSASAIDLTELSENENFQKTIVHELAHVYSRSVYPMTRDLDKSPLPLGATWLHFLAGDRSEWTLSDDTCASELLADVFGMVTLDDSYTGNYLSYCLGLTMVEPPQCEHSSLVALCASARSAVQGEVPQWYTDRYGDDSDMVWSDIITYTTFGATRDPFTARLSKTNLLQGFESAFGGYCSAIVATAAMFDGDTTITNPWQNGGCEPDAPLSVTAAAGATAGTFEVSWTAPVSAGGAPLSGYLVEWRQGSQIYHSSRRESVSSSVLSATINVGSSTDDVTIRVLAVNEIGSTTNGAATCSLDATDTWQCTFTPSAPQSRSATDNARPGRGFAGSDVPKLAEILID